VTWTEAADVIGAWIGDDAPTDQSKVDVWIGKAEREVKRRVPDIQTRIDAEADETPARSDLLESAKDVVVAMVTRVFRNPEGARQRNTTTTTGPFSDTGSVTYGGSTPGGLALTDDELASLTATKAQGAFTVSMIPTSSPFYTGA